MTTDIVKVKEEINNNLAQLGDKETLTTLVQTTFKGLQMQNVKRAILEGTLRGFTFNDFLQKNVYAIPFKDAYSLVTSIDYARKIGQKSGIVGKSEPKYKENDGKIVSCTVTVKKKTGAYVGDYSATVYFDEYNNGRNLWVTKPRTMIAKVAEMHALRAACPEELSQQYVEEEMIQEATETPEETLQKKVEALIEKIKTIDKAEELNDLKKRIDKTKKYSDDQKLEIIASIMDREKELTPKK